MFLNAPVCFLPHYAHSINRKITFDKTYRLKALCYNGFEVFDEKKSTAVKRCPSFKQQAQFIIYPFQRGAAGPSSWNGYSSRRLPVLSSGTGSLRQTGAISILLITLKELCKKAFNTLALKEFFQKLFLVV